MADHVNKQVRDAVIARVTGLTTTGARVHSYRVNPLDSITELPALIVRTISDTAVEAFVYQGRVYERQIEVLITAYAAATADLDDALDLIRKEVEQAIGETLGVSGETLVPVYTGSETGMTEGEQPAGELQMRYRVQVRHLAAVPDVIIDSER